MKSFNIAAEIGRILIEFEIFRQQQAAEQEKAGNITRQDDTLPASTQATKKTARKGESNTPASGSQIGKGRK